MLLPALATRYFYNPFIDTVKGRVYLPAQLSTGGVEKKKRGLVVLCTAVCKQLTVHLYGDLSLFFFFSCVKIARGRAHPPLPGLLNL